LSELPPSKKFELQIERIHQLLEAEGTAITWNDRIPDPDNPSQPSQIDIAIRRDGLLTIVECRLHKVPQDVTWIEELMGRRISLAADATIAVSASDFTTTAREKADRYGVILRDVASLSQQEIRNWGRKWKLKINYCEFSKVTCTLKVRAAPPSANPKITGIDGMPPKLIMWRLAFQEIMRQLDQNGWPGLPSTTVMSMAMPLLVDGKPPAAIEMRARVRRISEDVSVASVITYVDPTSAKRHAQVGHFDLGESEIIENCDDVVMIIDLSQIKIPDGCCFETASVDAGRVVKARPSLIGFEEAAKYQIPVAVRIEVTTEVS
jgi:hypothetical protein